MAWSDSRPFDSFVFGALDRSLAFDLDTDSFKSALYDNTPTPDRTVAETLSRYNTGQWATANEAYDGTEWDQGGEPITGLDVTIPSAGLIRWTGDDVPSGGTSATLTAYGCQDYDDTLANDPGVCFRYFGGVQTVTNGIFNIVEAATGILQATT